MKKIFFILFTLLVFAVAFADIRISSSGILFIQGDAAAGYPRAAELLALLMIFFSAIKYRFVPVKGHFYFFCVFLFLFALFKPYYMGYFRTSCFIPTLLFTGLLNFRISNEDLKKCFCILFYIISFSSLFVVISPFIDLGVDIYYIDSSDTDMQRFIGFGQSLPYQASFSLMAIPLFFYLINNAKGLKKVLFFTLVAFNTLAVIMTGARTAFVIIFVLLLYYYKDWKKLISAKYMVLVAAVAVAIIVYFGNILITSVTGRNDAGLSDRDVVWLIAFVLILTHPILGIQDFETDGKQFGNVLAHSQNGFFELIFWGGIFSFIVYWSAIYKCYLLNKIERINKRCFTGVLIIYMIFSIAEIIFFSVQAYYVIVIVLGLLTANSIEIKKEKTITQRSVRSL